MKVNTEHKDQACVLTPIGSIYKSPEVCGRITFWLHLMEKKYSSRPIMECDYESYPTGVTDLCLLEVVLRCQECWKYECKHEDDVTIGLVIERLHIVLPMAAFAAFH